MCLSQKPGNITTMYASIYFVTKTWKNIAIHAAIYFVTKTWKQHCHVSDHPLLKYQKKFDKNIRK